MESIRIVEFFKNKSILVTGSTGFLAKIFVEKVLRVQPEVKKLFLLVRAGDATSANQPYVAGEQSGLILEKKFLMGETLKGDSYLDIEAELSLADEKKRELRAEDAPEEAEKLAMKELGIRRTIDSVIIGYAKGKITCFFGDLDIIMDVVPGDMVVNAMMATMAAHSGQQAEFIYHMGSSVRNPVTYDTLEHCHFRYFLANPRVGRDGSVMPMKRLRFIKSMVVFRVFMTLRYKLPFEVMHLVNLLSCGRLARGYNELNRKYKFVMHLVELYKPYVYFDGCFDDLNMERLRMAMKKDDAEARMFDFDPKHVDWEDYFCSIHIPGVMKYAFK
ncbi:fatty acyl-CoA reductase [Musa troglodytarum]|uniref:Fatty acyl-CoA reductase n=1 Tax=Musa troglodytarum TaxID=320322 RepID=A0A9E7KRH6_9LILI|nr:fatty acyl-CoA reductase [Musa troglodytarum]